MCAIGGWLLGAQVRLDQLSLDRMMVAMADRGPDDTGRFVDADAGVAVGHNRLVLLILARVAISRW